ncbi:PSD1 and planctomycete cytochrome C domain-containing protein [Lignipirellula cremea]|uniref:Planctomycete cytochrome C n=1 Tax=Lignipirellula cremea TaxID=2528010 RepID=A0A518DZB0_9BACT|nr:PSD1 and planctomycete cytochrome C domain-containing protein [Lignipirellula cremea]QDU97141.1 Planctomycete cytochrome C [Lignipirellula cremea]
MNFALCPRLLLAAAALLATEAALAAAAEPVSFERQVQPLLERRCNRCHHEEEQSGGLDLTRRETMLRGGDELGPAIVPGEPDNSPLLLVLTGAQEPAMPENADPLPAAEIDLLRRWIAAGAKDDTTVFPAEDVAFFEREIRPVLATRCFKCHAVDEPEHGLRLTSRQSILTGGLRGPAAKAGDPEASLLLQAIRHQGDLQMPRGGDKLSDSQVDAFTRWIAKGLPWPADQRVLARSKQFTISDADRNHWAFRPLPADLPDTWSIDAALQAPHQALGITPAELADKHRLLRRVTYDLIGYPPTPEEIDAFVQDDSPNAFEKVVDRLLDSPHFGVRWGRHWLDYARNGSTGQPTRGPALDSQRYADWVAQCFQEDRPYDWFAQTHLAGDKMPGYTGGDYSIDQALAAATPLNGPRSFEHAEDQTFVLMDKLDEGVEFLGRSLLGVSLECARCHDHKYDPISQRDYYALLGFFQSSGYAPASVNAESRAVVEAAIARQTELMREKMEINAQLRTASLKLSMRGGNLRVQWKEKRAQFLAPKVKRLYQLELLILRAELADAESRGDKTSKDIRQILEQKEAALASFEAIIMGLAPKFDHFINGHKSQVGLRKRAQQLGLTDIDRELEAQNAYWEAEAPKWHENYRFGGYMKDDPMVADLALLDDRVEEIDAELPANLERPWEAPAAGYAYVRCDGGLRRAEDLDSFDFGAYSKQVGGGNISQKHAFVAGPFIGDARLLGRGDVLEPEDLVPRGFPEFFGGQTPPLEGSGRLQLAQWLTTPGSPQAALVARTAVNRAWQHLFGEALCRTPKELGRLGEPPELPEIIDGLAASFIREGWSMKKLIRRIILSEAWRRSSIADASLLAADPENRYFSRQTVRRLEYEPIANTMAWLRRGERFDSPPQRDSALPNAAEYAKHFDGPSVYELTERRVVSITATQSLFLMNNPAAAHQLAEDLVRRLGFTAETKLDNALEPLFTSVVQRPPSQADRDLARQFVVRRREQTGQSDPPAELREFASLLLCGNEILFLE